MANHKALLLGLGFWGTNWVQVLSRTKNCKIAGISGCHEDIERIAKGYTIPKDQAFLDYREAIERSDADVVIIAIPTKYHIDAAKRALAKGMHVLSEKPLAWDMAEANEILEYRKKYPNQKYMIDQNYRWRPHNQTLKMAINDGMIGNIGSLHVEFRQHEDLLGYREFLEMPLLQDVSIHHFDLVRFFSGRNCEEIYAKSFRPPWSRFQGQPSTEAVMRMEGDIFVNYNGTWAARGKATSWDGNFTITGDKGCLTLDAEDSVRFFAPGDEEGVLLEKVKMERTELDYALNMLIKAIENDVAPESSLEENYHSFAMVCAAERSVECGRPTNVCQCGRSKK